MIFTEAGVIYLHVAKTGGNAIQDALEQASDDRRTTKKHQDGVHRFNIRGNVTRSKHATLADYAEILGEGLARYRIAIGCREPFERAVSMYFSPHRWMRKADAGQWIEESPVWDLDAFARSIAKMPTAAHYLRHAGAIRTPDWLIRFETLEADFERFVTAASLRSGPLQHLNSTFADIDLVKRALDDRNARQIAEARFEEDYDLFGYGRP